MSRGDIYPAAITRLLPEAATQPTITPRAVIVHSAAGRGSLYGWWQNPQSNGLECHFWVSEQGIVEQYMPTTVRADANGEANGFAISIETESSVQATERWTDAQAAALVDLVDWICRTHGIPRRQMSSAVDSGLGWHVMFGAPGPWTRSRGKTCPGPARIPQFRDEIIPAVASRTRPAPAPDPEDFDMDETTLRRIIAEEIDAAPRLKTIEANTAKAKQYATEAVSILIGKAKRAPMFWRRIKG